MWKLWCDVNTKAFCAFWDNKDQNKTQFNSILNSFRPIFVVLGKYFNGFNKISGKITYWITNCESTQLKMSQIQQAEGGRRNWKFKILVLVTVKWVWGHDCWWKRRKKVMFVILKEKISKMSANIMKCHNEEKTTIKF